nr:beta-propeller fold lactonase family protein [Nocardioides seonyuensis]
MAALSAGALATLAAMGGLAALNDNDGGADEDPTEAGLASHRGMVEGTVWIANEGGGSLTAIDAATNRVATTVAGVEGPHNVQVAPDGASVWTVSGHDGYAAMLSAESLDLHGVVPTGSAPAHVVVSPDGSTAYTSNGADNTVSVIDTSTMKAISTVEVGQGPHGLRPSPDGRWLVVANVADTTLSVIDTRNNRLVTDVEVGNAPAQVAFSPDGRFVYASLNGADAVAKVDMTTRELVDTVAVGDGPIQTYVSGDNRYLLVANQGTEDSPGTTVSVIDTKTFTVKAEVETGQGSHGIVIDPSSRHAYITNIYGDDVAVLDLDELKVVARIPVGDKPNGVSFSSLALDAERDNVTLDVPDAPGGPDDEMGDGHEEGHESGH